MKPSKWTALSLTTALLMAFSAAVHAKGYTIDFESRAGIDPGSTGRITAVAGEVIAGKGSYLVDSTKSKAEWNERLSSDLKTIKLEGGKSYTIDFDYKILVPEATDGYFYAMLRVKSTGWGHDVGNVQWTSEDGMEGHKSVSFTLEDFPDYFLLVGARFQGKFTIDNITIVED